MPLVGNIVDGNSKQEVINKFRNLIDYETGIGQSSNAVTWGDLRTKVNAIASSIPLPTLINRELGASSLTKFNNILSYTRLNYDLDLYADFERNKFYEGGAATLASRVSDIWSGGLVDQLDGSFINIAANTLARTDNGLLTQPTRINYVANNMFVGAAVGIVGSGGSLPTGWTKSVTTGFILEVLAIGNSFGLPYIDISWDMDNTTGSGTAYPSINMGSIVQPLPAGETLTQSFYYQYLSNNYPLNSVTRRIGLQNTINSTTPDYPAARPTDGNTNIGTRYRAIATRIAPTGATSAASPRFQIDLPTTTAVKFSMRIWAPQTETGTFATNPILTNSNNAVTRTGNRQIVDLTGRLSQGVCGFIKADVKALANAADRLFEFNDGSSVNRMTISRSSGNTYQLFTQKDNVAGANFSIDTVTSGIITMVFGFGPNFMKIRLVGGVDPAVRINELPPVNRFTFFGRGLDTTSIGYGTSKKLALKYGTVNQAAFDAMYALAVAEAAAA